VAIKEMKVFFAGEDQNRITEQFALEASLLANLTHAGLPRVSNHFEERGTAYLVMDYIDGDSLGRMVDRYSETMPEGLVLMWTYEICEVLDYLHTRKPPIIFRDLKPSNVMITREGHVKLIDFGISKIYDKEREGATRTAVRGAGTPGFQPPEQYGAQSSRRTDGRSDLYALGATMYAVMSFTIPPEAVDRGLNGVPLKPIRELCKTISDPFADMIEQMLHLNPDERPASAREVMKVLLQLLGGVPPRDSVDLPVGSMKEGIATPEEPLVEPVTVTVPSPKALAANPTTPMAFTPEGAAAMAAVPSTHVPHPAVAVQSMPSATPSASASGALHHQATQLASDVGVLPEGLTFASRTPQRKSQAPIYIIGTMVVAVAAVFGLMGKSMHDQPAASGSPSTAVTTVAPSGRPTGVALVPPRPSGMPVDAKLAIQVLPKTARVWLDGSPVTTQDGLVQVPGFPVQVKMKADGYMPYLQDVKERPEKGLIPMIPMAHVAFTSKTAQTVTIHSVAPDPDVPVPSSPQKLKHLSMEVPPGAYALKFEADGFVPDGMKLVLKPGEKKTVSRELHRPPPIPVRTPVFVPPPRPNRPPPGPGTVPGHQGCF
ncbi:MAG TPA: protein kinase, partial [Candidatus Xenobia bacterium]